MHHCNKEFKTKASLTKHCGTKTHLKLFRAQQEEARKDYKERTIQNLIDNPRELAEFVMQLRQDLDNIDISPTCNRCNSPNSWC